MTALLMLAGAAPRYLGLLRSQYWNRHDRENYIWSRIEETLRAASRIPFYAGRVDAPGPRDLQRLPILLRSQITQLNQSVRALYPPHTVFSRNSSSGSTGTPVEFLFDRSHQRGRFAARARYLRENGWSQARCNVWLVHTGSYTSGEDGKLIHSRFLLKTHFLPIPPDFRELAIQLQRLDPVYLYAYPSFLEALLHSVEHAECRLSALRQVFTGAEVLDEQVRSRAKKLLGVDIADNYGSTEAFIAWQCRLGKYHVNAEHVFLEIVDENGYPVAPGEMGRVLITTLENHLMPLVRYEIGDYAVPSGEPCRCGRTLPTIDRVVGRGINLFRLEGGQLLSPWLLIVAVRDRIQVTQFQIVQKAIDRFLVKFVSPTLTASRTRPS